MNLRRNISTSSFAHSNSFTNFWYAEVNYDWNTIINQDILGLYVPMKDVFFMDLAQSR